MIYTYFLPFYGLPLHSFDCVLWCTKVLNFDVVQCIYFYHNCFSSFFSLGCKLVASRVGLAMFCFCHCLLMWKRRSSFLLHSILQGDIRKKRFKYICLLKTPKLRKPGIDGSAGNLTAVVGQDLFVVCQGWGRSAGKVCPGSRLELRWSKWSTEGTKFKETLSGVDFAFAWTREAVPSAMLFPGYLPCLTYPSPGSVGQGERF